MTVIVAGGSTVSIGLRFITITCSAEWRDILTYNVRSANCLPLDCLNYSPV